MRTGRALSILLLLIPAVSSRVVAGQGTQRVPDATDPTLIHNRDLEAAARLKANRRIHGTVLIFGGTRPQHPVEIDVSCPTLDRLMATTDSRGKFSFSFDVSRQSDTDLTSAGCFLYASLEGFRSETVSLADLIKAGGTNLGKIVLTPALESSIKADAATSKFAASANEPKKGPATTAVTSAPPPTRVALGDRNTPLLANSSAYTCLESVMPIRTDLQGRPFTSETIRAEIAVSEGREIYGPADGKNFSADARSELLGNSFSTTGLFSSIARALVSSNQLSVEPAGELTSNGHSLFRYDFRSLPGTAGWTIAYGKVTGMASEHGWFLVEGRSHVLREVFVAASGIPGNLKLTGLAALIEFEAETIAGHRVLLPSVARVDAEEQSGIRRTSFMSFDHCRAFTADSAVFFQETNIEAQADLTSYSARLPANIEIPVSLNSAFNATPSEDDGLITATVVRPVFGNGRKLMEAGATVEGHVRAARGGHGILIQLDRVETLQGWAPFYARLVTLVSSNQVRINAKDQKTDRLAAPETDGDEQLPRPEVPGVAVLTLETKETVLLAGTLMLWKTESL